MEFLELVMNVVVVVIYVAAVWIPGIVITLIAARLLLGRPLDHYEANDCVAWPVALPLAVLAWIGCRLGDGLEAVGKWLIQDNQ